MLAVATFMITSAPRGKPTKSGRLSSSPIGVPLVSIQSAYSHHLMHSYDTPDCTPIKYAMVFKRTSSKCITVLPTPIS